MDVRSNVFSKNSLILSEIRSAPIGIYPDDSPFAKHIMSGSISNRSDAKISPVLPKPVITSSKQRSISFSMAIFLIV